MTDLPDSIPIPLGRLVSVRWSDHHDQRIWSISADRATVGLTRAQFGVWSAASMGLPRTDLLRTSLEESPETAYATLVRYGLLAEISTRPGRLLRAMKSFRWLAHTPVGIDPTLGRVVVGGPADDAVLLSPVVQEVYSWSPGTHSLAEAVEFVSSRAKRAGVRDPEVVRSKQLAVKVLTEALPTVHQGFTSFGFVGGAR